MSAGLRILVVAFVFGAMFETRVAFSREGRNGESGFNSNSSNNSSSNREPSASERIRGDIANVESYRQTLAAQKAELEKKERELSEKASTRPSEQAEKEMDEAPIVGKPAKRNTMIEKATEMVDDHLSEQLASVREKIVSKEKELKAIDRNLEYHRDQLKKARDIEQKKEQENAEGRRDKSSLGRGDAREVPGNIGLGGVRDRTG